MGPTSSVRVHCIWPRFSFTVGTRLQFRASRPAGEWVDIAKLCPMNVSSSAKWNTLLYESHACCDVNISWSTEVCYSGGTEDNQDNLNQDSRVSRQILWPRASRICTKWICVTFYLLGWYCNSHTTRVVSRVSMRVIIGIYFLNTR
jgi:hypothetical protein